eukprot:scaffold8173_cov18-Prasinocladus_malaysianus.AAC.1
MNVPRSSATSLHPLFHLGASSILYICWLINLALSLERDEFLQCPEREIDLQRRTNLMAKLQT